MKIAYLKLMLLVLITMMASASARSLTETFKKQVDFREGSLLMLDNTNGRVIIESWDKAELYIEAEKRVRAGSEEDAQRIMEKLEIEIEERDGEVRIKTAGPRRSRGGFWEQLFGGHANFSVHYKIYVPRRADLDITNTNGDVEAIGVSGDIRLASTNGKVIAEDVSGRVDIYTTNGSIEAEVGALSSQGDMAMETTNGSIRLFLPTDAAFDLRARTTNGSIKTDFPLSVRGKFSGKRIEGRVNGGGARLRLETTNGSIHIRER